MQPNDRLPQESELIEMLGSSRSTIREALKSLEVQGLVQNTTGSSAAAARVAPVSINRIVGLLSNYFYFQSISTAQIYQIRRLIEPSSASRSGDGHLTAAHFKALDKAIAVQGSIIGADPRTGSITATPRSISTTSRSRSVPIRCSASSAASSTRRSAI